MVPLVAYNFGAGNQKRMARFSSLARWSILLFSSLCTILFFIFAEPLVGIFIKDPLTVEMGTAYLKMRCFALPFMMIGYHVINYMNAVNKGKVSFGLAILRHLILIIPIMLIMNYLWGINGLMWSQVIADVINAVIALLIMRYFVIRSDLRPNR
jgi:Na+-driven multidrug efflux pump